jgi:hypothetical protein
MNINNSLKIPLKKELVYVSTRITIAKAKRKPILDITIRVVISISAQK